MDPAVQGDPKCQSFYCNTCTNVLNQLLPTIKTRKIKFYFELQMYYFKSNAPICQDCMSVTKVCGPQIVRYICMTTTSPCRPIDDIGG